MAAERIGRDNGEVLFLNDNYNADKTAKTIGMVVCVVYDKSSKEYTKEIKSISGHYINDFLELLNL